jgi:hypothetical protein
MNNNTTKSANQLYRESGTTLPFKEWIEREKAKGIHIPNVEANNEMLNLLGNETKPLDKDNKKMIGNIMFTIGIISLAYITYRLVKTKGA